MRVIDAFFRAQPYLDMVTWSAGFSIARQTVEKVGPLVGMSQISSILIDKREVYHNLLFFFLLPFFLGKKNIHN